ncbi:MAG TPA: hypothetical protein EYN66_00745 [Myxococcales bacterium]|nr:hypothetical protein [Myxococcales bacterium]
MRSNSRSWSRALSASQKNADFVGPTAALSYRFYRDLSVLLPNESPLSGNDSPEALLRAIEDRCGPAIATTAKGCMLAFTKARENATRAPHPLGITSIQEFEQLWNDSQEVILAMHNLNQGQQSTGRAA